MKAGSASGLQIAFFTFAVLLLAAPLGQWIGAFHAGTAGEAALLERTSLFAVGALILFGIPALRRRCREFLSVPIAPGARAEVVLATALKAVLFPFALAGGFALLHWVEAGEHGLAAWARGWMPADKAMARAFTTPELLRSLLLAGFVAPVLEELVFRGFLHRAWERRWGWFPAMILTSGLFGLYHATFAAAFLGGVFLTCLYRRTGSLRASIAGHAVSNIFLWYPLLGPYIVPRDAEAPGDLGTWAWQLTCLLIASVALPMYVWLARRERTVEEAFPPTVPHAAFSK